MKRVLPLLLLALAACTDREPPPLATAPHGAPHAVVAGALPSVKTYWKDPYTLWVYNSTPEVGVTSRIGTDQVDQMIQSAGARLVRVNLNWDATMEDKPYQYTSAFYGFSYALQLLQNHNLVPVVVVTYESAFPHPPGLPMTHDSLGDMSEFNQRLAQYMATAARTFPQVRFWEVWNEADGGWAGMPWGSWNGSGFDRYQQGWAYARTLQAVYPAIKAANPNAWVLVSSLTGNEGFVQTNPGQFAVANSVSWNFINGVYDAGGGAYFDFMNLHAYGKLPDATSQPGGSMRSKAQDILSLMQSKEGSSTRPLWLTEFGTAGAEYVHDYGWPHDSGLQDGPTFDTHQRDWWSGALSYLSSGPYVKATGMAILSSEQNPGGGIYPAGRSAGDYGYGILYGDVTPRPAYTYLAGSGFNGGVFGNPLGQGSVTVYSPNANPDSVPYTRSGDYVTLTNVQVDNLVPTVVRFVPTGAPLTATVTGPHSVRPNATCTWTANAGGGRMPYSYGWVGVTGSLDTQSTTSRWSSIGSKTISAIVVDENGNQVQVLYPVSVSNSAPSC